MQRVYILSNLFHLAVLHCIDNCFIHFLKIFYFLCNSVTKQYPHSSQHFYKVSRSSSVSAISTVSLTHSGCFKWFPLWLESARLYLRNKQVRVEFATLSHAWNSKSKDLWKFLTYLCNFFYSNWKDSLKPDISIFMFLVVYGPKKVINLQICNF